MSLWSSARHADQRGDSEERSSSSGSTRGRTRRGTPSLDSLKEQIQQEKEEDSCSSLTLGHSRVQKSPSRSPRMRRKKKNHHHKHKHRKHKPKPTTTKDEAISETELIIQPRSKKRKETETKRRSWSSSFVSEEERTKRKTSLVRTRSQDRLQSFGINVDSYNNMHNIKSSKDSSKPTKRARGGRKRGSNCIERIKTSTNREIVTRGTLEALIAELAGRNFQDVHYVQEFLFTHDYFIKPVTLLKLLVRRYEKHSRGKKVLKSKKNTFDYEIFIQLRIVNVLKRWIEFKYEDLKHNKDWMNVMQNFIRGLKKSKVENEKEWSGILLRQMREHHKMSYGSINEIRKSPRKSRKKPKTVLEISTRALAHHLTLADHILFKKVKISEFYRQGWLDMTSERSMNLKKFVEHFNEVSYWVASQIILTTADHKNRALVLSKFVSVMKVFRSTNNFNGIMQILAALNFSSIRRLDRTWKSVGRSVVQAVQEMESFMKQDHNYAEYRIVLAETSPPYIPFIGLHLNDIVYAESVMSSKGIEDDDGYINFDDLRRLAKALFMLQQCQRTNFKFSDDEYIWEYLEKSTVLSEEDLMVASLNAEQNNKANALKSQTKQSVQRAAGEHRVTRHLKNVNMRILMNGEVANTLVPPESKVSVCAQDLTESSDVLMSLPRAEVVRSISNHDFNEMQSKHKKQAAKKFSRSGFRKSWNKQGDF